MLTEFLEKAIGLNADRLEIEYKDRQELVTAFRGNLGIGIGAVDSTERDELFEDFERLRKSKRATLLGKVYRATASKIPVILAVLDGNLVCSYNVYYWHIFNNHPNYGCKSLEYSQNFRSITVSGLPYLMKNPHFDAVALLIPPTIFISKATTGLVCFRLHVGRN